MWFQVTNTGTTEFSGSPDAPFFFLVLGNDGRSDADKGLGDAIHVVGVNPAAHSASILNVPRDTQAPGGDKINAAHALNGLPGIVKELNAMMGIQIQYAITTNFPGFIDMVDQIGGIDVNIPPMTEGDKIWNDDFTARSSSQVSSTSTGRRRSPSHATATTSRSPVTSRAPAARPSSSSPHSPRCGRRTRVMPGRCTSSRFSSSMCAPTTCRLSTCSDSVASR